MRRMHRRQMLKSGAGAAGALLLPLNLPVLAQESLPVRSTVPENFVPFSSAMTGIPVEQLTPPTSQDDARLAEIYYSLLHAGVPQGIEQALSWYNTCVNEYGMSLQTVADRFLSDQTGLYGAPETKPAARLAMMLWLFGVWYGGTEARNKPEFKQWINPEYQVDFVVSGHAYVRGWIWSIAQAHPLGFSQFKFGSWATEPPTLKQYGINT